MRDIEHGCASMTAKKFLEITVAFGLPTYGNAILSDHTFEGMLKLIYQSRVLAGLTQK